MFALNSRHFWGPHIRAGDAVRWPYLAAPTAPIDEQDIAVAAVLTLTRDRHAGMEYVLTGPESLSQYEQISTIGSVIGRPLRIKEVSPMKRAADVTKPCGDGSEQTARRLGCRIGQPAYVTATFQELTGRQPRTFRDWVTANAAQFRA